MVFPEDKDSQALREHVNLGQTRTANAKERKEVVESRKEEEKKGRKEERSMRKS